MDLKGKTALVTGAARRVGKGIAVALAERGADVVVHFGSSREAAERTAAGLRELGVGAWTVAADLTRPEEIERLFEEVAAAAGRLDLLVNSAASFERQPLDEIEADDWDRVMALNLRAPFLCIRSALPLLRGSERPDGETAAIVNIGDQSGLDPWAGFAHHGASKAALLHLTKIAARELAPEVRVSSVVPGAILPPPGEDPEDEAWRRRGERIPRGRTGDPADVGRAVAFLASHEFVTGVVLAVDGGEGLG